VDLEELFQRADLLLYKDKQPEKAETLYRQILDLQPDNVDAINSIASCLKLGKGNTMKIK
jgi:tetratricopeptide (TPR) repeat protein